MPLYITLQLRVRLDSDNHTRVEVKCLALGIEVVLVG